MDTIDQQQKIERYILNRMDEEEASEFEAFYLSNQECLKQLKFAEKLHFGLKFISEVENQVDKLPTTQLEANSSTHWWATKIPIWSAAAVLLIALLPLGAFIQQLIPSNIPTSKLLVHRLPISTMRSIESEPLTTGNSYIQENTGQTILSVFIDTEIEGLTHTQYRFRIRNEENTLSDWKRANLQLDSNDMLYIDLGDNYLKAGRYEYEIVGLGKNRTPVKIASGKLLVSAHPQTSKALKYQ